MTNGCVFFFLQSSPKSPASFLRELLHWLSTSRAADDFRGMTPISDIGCARQHPIHKIFSYTPCDLRSSLFDNGAGISFRSFQLCSFF